MVRPDCAAVICTVLAPMWYVPARSTTVPWAFESAMALTMLATGAAAVPAFVSLPLVGSANTAFDDGTGNDGGSHSSIGVVGFGTPHGPSCSAS